MMKDPLVASKIKSKLRGKSIKVVLCDVVLDEIHRTRGFTPRRVISRISRLLDRTVETLTVDNHEKENARDISTQFQICHKGDNMILSLCQTKNLILVTYDKMLLKACQFVGVAGFHPLMTRGI